MFWMRYFPYLSSSLCLEFLSLVHLANAKYHHDSMPLVISFLITVLQQRFDWLKNFWKIWSILGRINTFCYISSIFNRGCRTLRRSGRMATTSTQTVSGNLTRATKYSHLSLELQEHRKLTIFRLLFHDYFTILEFPAKPPPYQNRHFLLHH